MEIEVGYSEFRTWQRDLPARGDAGPQRKEPSIPQSRINSV